MTETCGTSASEQAMNRRAMRWAAVALGAVLTSAAPAPVRAQATKYDKPPAYKLTDDDKRTLDERTAELEQAVAKLPPLDAMHRDALADVAVYAKAGAYARRFNEFYA